MRANIRMERPSRHERLELAVDGLHVALTRLVAGRSTAACTVNAHTSPEEAKHAYRDHVLRALESGYVPVRATRPFA